jgi:uncharacterized short protein YbdD (DUF466 family)
MRELLGQALVGGLRRARETAYLMVGQGDYQRYVAHVAAHHPERQPMTEAEFVRAAMERRYGKGASRCC